MSSSKLDTSGVFQPITVHTQQSQKTLTGDVEQVRESGIEFRSPAPIQLWKEMSVDLQVPGESAKVRCTGVVVACQGSRHAGYLVSILFLNLSRHAHTQLSLMACSPAA